MTKFVIIRAGVSEVHLAPQEAWRDEPRHHEPCTGGVRLFTSAAAWRSRPTPDGSAMGQPVTRDRRQRTGRRYFAMATMQRFPRSEFDHHIDRRWRQNRK
jgi:hypothetical protein